LKVPAAVGVPEIVITLADQAAVTPEGKPDAEPIPVAPVVAIVIGVKGEVAKIDGVVDGAAAVLEMMHPHDSPVEDIISA
jgi:hypothetical protein